jgi:hypothetical protein
VRGRGRDAATDLACKIPWRNDDGRNDERGVLVAVPKERQVAAPDDSMAQDANHFADKPVDGVQLTLFAWVSRNGFRIRFRPIVND